jgi:hypothetical protein
MENNQNRAIFENRGGNLCAVWLPDPAFLGTVPFDKKNCYESILDIFIHEKSGKFAYFGKNVPSEKMTL